MRKIVALVTMLVFSLALIGCGSEKSDTAEKPSAPVSAGSKVLVVYFSRADENTGVGYIEKGNTRILAEMIADKTKADIFEIKPAKSYPKEYEPAIELAKQEKENNARPEVVGQLPDVQKYDVIFLGYPIWWGDLPMAVYTFLEKENFSGKTIIPFCTHEGSGISGTEGYIAEITKAKVLDGLEMRGSVAQNSRDKAKEEVMEWLKKLGY